MQNGELRGYCENLRQIDHDVRALVDGLSDDQLSWRSNPKEWSIAHCIDHLAVTNGKLVPRFEAAVRQLREQSWRSNGPFHYNWLERRFIALLAPNAAPWLRAPGVYRPALQPAPRDAMKRFMALEERLQACIEAADGYDIGRVKVASPVSALLQLRVGAWFAATLNHNRNHLEQARNVRSLKDFPD